MNKTNRLILASTIDGICAVTAFWGAYWLRLEEFPQELLLNTLIVSTSTIASFWILGVYKRIWRYASTNDLIVILKATLLSVTITAFIIFLMTRLEEIPRSTLIIYWILLLAISGGIRIVYRLLRDKTLSPIYNENERIDVLIIGANEEAESFIRNSSKIYDVPIVYHGRTYEEGKKIKPRHILGIIGMIIREKILPTEN